MPLLPTISSATGSKGLAVIPAPAKCSTPARPKPVTVIIVASDHLVLQRLYITVAINTVGRAISADCASSLLDSAML